MMITTERRFFWGHDLNKFNLMYGMGTWIAWRNSCWWQPLRCVFLGDDLKEFHVYMKRKLKGLEEFLLMITFEMCFLGHALRKFHAGKCKNFNGLEEFLLMITSEMCPRSHRGKLYTFYMYLYVCGRVKSKKKWL